MVDSEPVEIDVRRIVPTDWTVLKTTRLAALADSPFAFGSTYDEEVTRSDEDWQERAGLAAAGPARSTFLARTGHRVVGLAGGHREEDQPSSVQLVSMWTSREMRRSGAGRLLVSAVVRWATDTNAASVGLWVTRGNEPAQRLYETMGFRVTGDVQPLPSDPCADEIRMLLDLD
jgi:GNAT superfamily N-acetyltransferase